MFMMVRAHWIDIGGMSTGFGAGPTVADPWLEGLQLDQLKIYEGGKLNDTLYRVLKDNIRFPESSLGDMKSQMAACRLAAKRMDEMFDKYGRETILVGDRDDLRRDRAEVPQRGLAAPRRRLRGGVRDRRRRRAQGRAGADPRQGHDQERRDDHRPVGLLGRAQVGRQLAHARRRARRLQGADRPERSGQRRLVPRAQRHHPGRQRDDGALSGADVVVEHHDPDGGRHHRQGAGEADEGSRAGRTSRPARRRRRVLRRASEDQAPLRGAEHRGRRLGRTPLRGRRVRHRVGLPGRRAQRLDRRHRAEMPGAGGGPRAAHRLRRRRQASRRARHRHAGEEPGRRPLEFRADPPQHLSALGPVGRRRRRSERLSAAAARRERLQDDGRRAYPGAAARLGDRAHRRRRRLGRSARARSRAGARRRAWKSWCRATRRARNMASCCATT